MSADSRMAKAGQQAAHGSLLIASLSVVGLQFVFALPAVLVFGELYSRITGQPDTNGFIKI